MEICDICGHVEYNHDNRSINNGHHLDKHIQADPAVKIQSDTQDAIISKFHKSVQSGPDYVCRCCNQTWFKEGVRTASNISETMLQKCRITRHDLVCSTCYQHLKTGCLLTNSLGFPEKPPELDLPSFYIIRGTFSCSTNTVYAVTRKTQSWTFEHKWRCCECSCFFF